MPTQRRGGDGLLTATRTRPRQPPSPSLYPPLLHLLQGPVLSGQFPVEAHAAGHWRPQVAKQDFTAAPGQLQDVVCQGRHGGVAHVVQVEHVPQVLHDLVLGGKAGVGRDSGPVPAAQRPSRPPRAPPRLPEPRPVHRLRPPSASCGPLWAGLLPGTHTPPHPTPPPTRVRRTAQAGHALRLP